MSSHPCFSLFVFFFFMNIYIIVCISFWYCFCLVQGHMEGQNYFVGVCFLSFLCAEVHKESKHSQHLEKRSHFRGETSSKENTNLSGCLQFLLN